MLPDFALHHLPLYTVTAGALLGIGTWAWARWVQHRQSEAERREAIAESVERVGQRALASPLLTLDLPEPTERTLGRDRPRARS